MIYETIIKISILIFAIFISIYKLYSDIYLTKKSQCREEYDFAKKFLKEKDEKLHPFVLEKGYQAISGSSKLTNETIARLLSLKNCTQIIKNIVFSHFFLNISISDDILLVKFKKPYNVGFIRKIIINFFRLSYCFAFITAFYPIFFIDMFLPIHLVPLIFFSIFGVFCIYCEEKLKVAETLVNEQSSYN